MRARADPPTGIPRKAARLGTREEAGPRTGGKNQPSTCMRALVPGSLFSPSAYNCAWLPACAQYTGGREKSCSIRVFEGPRDSQRPPLLSPLPPSSPSGDPEGGRGQPSFHSCIWGQGRGHEVWSPHLLLQPGAMAPSPPDPSINAADAHTSSRAARRDSARSRWPRI